MSKQKGVSTTQLFVREVPTTLKQQFKAYCARRGYTMRDTLMALMAKAIENEQHIDIPRPAERA